jgi:hypothetical protein
MSVANLEIYLYQNAQAWDGFYWKFVKTEARYASYVEMKYKLLVVMMERC